MISASHVDSHLMVAQVVQKARLCLVLLRWLCLQYVVSMNLDFDSGISRRMGCSVSLAVSFPADYMTEDSVAGSLV